MERDKIRGIKLRGQNIYWPVAKKNEHGVWVKGGIILDIMTDEMIEDALAMGLFEVLYD